MAEDTWGNRYNFLKGGLQPSSVTSGQDALSKVEELLGKLGKMQAVRPSPPVQKAYEILGACSHRIRQSIYPQNNTSILNDAAVSDPTETGRGPSLS